MKAIPWYASSQNNCLSEKVDCFFPRSAKALLSLPNLERVKFMKDGNQGGEYFRFFGFFKEDTNRYFTIFGRWDLPVPFFSLKEGQYFQIDSGIWKVTGFELHQCIVEMILI